MKIIWFSKNPIARPFLHFNFLSINLYLSIQEDTEKYIDLDADRWELRLDAKCELFFQFLIF